MEARTWWLVVALAACSGSSAHVDADLPGPFTLTVENVLEDTEIPTVGTLIHVQDTEGNIFGVMRYRSVDGEPGR